jgi:hypothetical protein
MSNLLTWNHATVTVCHSKTKNLPDVVSRRYFAIQAQHMQPYNLIYKYPNFQYINLDDFSCFRLEKGKLLWLPLVVNIL